MREERGQVAGDLVIAEPFELWGTVGGSITVGKGGKFYLRGSVFGDLIVEPGGRVHIYGQVLGNVRLAENTKVIHSGVVGGDFINDGGRLLIERAAKVGGKVKTKSGETKVEPAPHVRSEPLRKRAED